MPNQPGRPTRTLRGAISRRELLRTLGAVSVTAPLAGVLGSTALSAQGRCMTTFGTPACDTSPIPPVFEPTGWKTAALDHVTFSVADYRAEAAFYAALMGWTLRSDDGTQAVMDIGDWGSVVFRKAAPGAFDDEAPAGGRGGPRRAKVDGFSFAIDQWDAAKVKAALQKRGLMPRADNDGAFESFHVHDPDGFDLQISNGGGYARARRTPSTARLAATAAFAATGWKTVWLDHLSFGATNYKKSVSFYMNLLGWAPTYDEGSQQELMIADVGDIIIRGGNPLDPGFGSAPARRTGIDHISFGI
ncbi:MAG: hypothetical protein AB7V01_08370, partial [Vicinamibacterales bacterium]